MEAPRLIQYACRRFYFLQARPLSHVLILLGRLGWRPLSYQIERAMSASWPVTDIQRLRLGVCSWVNSGHRTLEPPRPFVTHTGHWQLIFAVMHNHSTML
jgi:hypothetical protein